MNRVLRRLFRREQRHLTRRDKEPATPIIFSDNWLGAAQWIQALAVISAAGTVIYSDISMRQQKVEVALHYSSILNEQYVEKL
ncbi:MAG: hypothetical protein R3C04_12315, partial [Hyphomonas sp.]